MAEPWRKLADEAAAAIYRDSRLTVAQERCHDLARRVAEEALPLREHQLLVAKEQRDAAEREVEALKAKLKERGACEVCWHVAWAPVPPEDPDAIADTHGGFMRCDYCWLHSLAEGLKAKLEQADASAFLRGTKFMEAKVEMVRAAIPEMEAAAHRAGRREALREIWAHVATPPVYATEAQQRQWAALKAEAEGREGEGR